LHIDIIMAAPFDNTLVLGQLLDPKQIENLEKLAAIDHPENMADRKLGKLMLSERKLTGIHDQMKQFIDESDVKSTEQLGKMFLQLEAVKIRIGKAAGDLIDKTLAGLDAKDEFREKTPEKRIGVSIESPIDFTLSSTAVFPLSSDGMEFDVQYFRSEANEETTESTIDNKDGRGIKSGQAGQGEGGKGIKKTDPGQGKKKIKDKVVDFVKNWMTSSNVASASTATGSGNGGGGGVFSVAEARNTSQIGQSETANSVKDTMSSQEQNHDIEGTLVIVANCTHKNADVISPCILDPVKLLSAWNTTYPDDKLSTESHSMFTAALELKSEREKPGNALHLLTGVTRASSFIGMAHILKQTTSESSQTADQQASKMRRIVEQQASIGANTGRTTENLNSAANQISKMMSSSNIFSHCSLVTKGIIPNIAASDIESTVKTLEPSPVKLLQQMNAIKASGDKSVDDLSDANLNAKKVAEARTGAQFLEMSNEFAKDTVSAIKTKEANKSKIIDTNSMMNAFTDYIKKAQEGNCGIPVNFYIKKIDKGLVARTYINVFYPTGVKDGMSQSMGAIGATADRATNN